VPSTPITDDGKPDVVLASLEMSAQRITVLWALVILADSKRKKRTAKARR